MQKQILITLSLQEFEGLVRDCVRSELKIYHKEPPKDVTQYISARDAAAILKISQPTLRKYSRNSLFKVYRIGRTLRFLKSEIEQSLPSMRTVKHSRSHV
jgi:predicted DNA-binding transcriptional regulator AlpA